MNLKFFAVFFVLTISHTFASECMNLSGTYSCNFSNNNAGEKIIKITQTMENQKTILKINDEERIADGLLHQTSKEGFKNMRYTAECDGSVVIHVDANVLNPSGKIIGDMFSHLILYKMNSSLHYFEMGSFDLETEYTPFDREATCRGL